jgi:hypothetical protein
MLDAATDAAARSRKRKKGEKESHDRMIGTKKRERKASLNGGLAA